jgi:DNA-binding CsgD family transcriptional regulator
MRARLTSRHLVGRVGELAELELALREAADRHPVLVLLGGESGVGKTRLVAAFEQGLSGKGALVLRGESLEQGDGELPYAGLVGALRPLVRERHPALDALSPSSRTQLAALLPGLSEGRQPSDAHGPAGQLRLFEAVLELVDLLGEATPVVLVLEDLHWADRSTRAFVAFLARSVRQERVLLLLTYRSDELHRRHPLRPLLSELERLERARRIELEPFDRGELVEALADILGDRPGEPLVARLFARSEGNPLYIEELLAAGLDGRGAAPQSLRDAFMLRIERLPPDAQRAARVIAVGRGLDEEMIAEVTGIAHAELNLALREALAEQVLVTGDDDRFFFRHALLREAVYDDLLPGERGELHLALARALEHRIDWHDEANLERATNIASHYAAAGDQPAALHATVHAAQAAQRIHAYGEAAALAERALELWPRVRDAAETLDIDHVGLITLAADAHQLGGDRARGEVLVREALRELDPDAARRRYSALLGRLARAQLSLNRGQEGVATAQRALAMLPAAEDSSERASLRAWLARTRFLRGRFYDAIKDGEEALTAAVAAGDPSTEGQVLNTLGMAQIALGQVDEGAARLRRAMAIARDIDDIDGLSYAYVNLADLLNLAGRTTSALAIAQEGLATIPRRFSGARDWISLTISELAFEAGDWETARAHLGPPPSQLIGVLLIFRQLREADLALGVGDEDVAAECLAAIEPLVAVSFEPQWQGTYGALAAELRRRRHDLPGARAAVEQALDRLELCTDDVMRIARVTAAGIRIEADRAQRARDLRDAADARDALARARIHMQRLRAAAQVGGPVEQAWKALGAAELARGRGRGDASLWAGAAGEWDALGRPYLAAVCRWHEAEALLEAGDRGSAAEAARVALEASRRLGSRWLADEVTRLCDRARLDVAARGNGAGAQAVPDSAPVTADPFGLTPRERQVLALVAEGATNRQIGVSLFMAEKTASVHVSRILSKLGVQSRTQAAAVAHRLRLS